MLLIVLSVSVALLGCATDPREAVGDNGIVVFAPLKAYSDYEKIMNRMALHYPDVIPVPQRGILVASGSFFTKSASWVIFDLDAETLTVVYTLNIPDNNVEKTIVKEKQEIKLTHNDQNKLINLANLAWSPKRKTEERLVMDVTRSLILMDRDDIKQIKGFGAGDALSDAMWEQAGKRSRDSS